MQDKLKKDAKKIEGKKRKNLGIPKLAWSQHYLRKNNLVRT